MQYPVALLLNGAAHKTKELLLHYLKLLFKSGLRTSERDRPSVVLAVNASLEGADALRLGIV